jgi:hypothetical protein
MNSISALTRVRRAAFVLLLGMYLSFGDASRAQSFETPLVGLEQLPVAVVGWPIVDWGLARPINKLRDFDEPLGEMPILEGRAKVGLTVAFPERHHERELELADNGRAGSWLGPVRTIDVPLPGDPVRAIIARGERESEEGSSRIEYGNVSFNRAMARLEVQISEVTTTGDLSRQSETVIVQTNVTKPGDFPPQAETSEGQTSDATEPGDLSRQSETPPVQTSDVARPSDLSRQSETLEAQTSEVTKPGDPGRQSELVVGRGNVGRALWLGGWAIIAIGAMVIIIALAIGIPRKRSRRRSSHEHQHQHRHRRRHHHHRRSRDEAY